MWAIVISTFYYLATPLHSILFHLLYTLLYTCIVGHDRTLFIASFLLPTGHSPAHSSCTICYMLYMHQSIGFTIFLFPHYTISIQLHVGLQINFPHGESGDTQLFSRVKVHNQQKAHKGFWLKKKPTVSDGADTIFRLPIISRLSEIAHCSPKWRKRPDYHIFQNASLCLLIVFKSPCDLFHLPFKG